MAEKKIKELKAYLKANCAKTCEDSQHRNLVDEVAGNPGSLGISAAADVYREVRIIDDGILIAQPDILAIDPDDALYIIECKTVRRSRKRIGNLRYAMNSQMWRTYDFIMRRFSISGTMMGIYSLPKSKKMKTYILERPIEDLRFA
jgi:hypothetical protein